jgi:hypothetical protein
MKAWISIQSHRTNLNKDIPFEDFFRAQIFESQMAVSDIFRGQRLIVPAISGEFCDISTILDSDTQLKKAVARSKSHSKTLKKFLEKEEQYGELF